MYLVVDPGDDGELVGDQSGRRRHEHVVAVLVPLRAVEWIVERAAGRTPPDELPDPVWNVGRERVPHTERAVLVVEDEHRAPVGQVRRHDSPDGRDLEDVGTG